MPLALGWDVHRKFSKVSLEQMTAEGEIRGRSSGLVWSTRTGRRCAAGCRACPRARRWLWRRPTAGLGSPTCWRRWDWSRIWGTRRRSRFWPRREAKGDRIDGDRLGKFQLRGILPEAYLATPEVRRCASGRMRYRMALSRCARGVKNRMQAILHRLGILHPFSDLFGKAGRRFLQAAGFAGGVARGVERVSRSVGPHRGADRASGSIGWRANLKVDETVQLLDDDPRHRADPGARDLRGNRGDRAFSQPSPFEQLCAAWRR